MGNRMEPNDDAFCSRSQAGWTLEHAENAVFIEPWCGSPASLLNTGKKGSNHGRIRSPPRPARRRGHRGQARSRTSRAVVTAVGSGQRQALLTALGTALGDADRCMIRLARRAADRKRAAGSSLWAASTRRFRPDNVPGLVSRAHQIRGELDGDTAVDPG